jgi:signal transduction histidine kinase/ActR/RegA family two-component response regulator
MQAPLNVFNWSISKSLRTIGDPVDKAKITVFYYLYLGNFLKIGILLPDFIKYDDDKQIIRCCIGLLFTVVVLKFLLWKPQHFQKLIFFTLSAAVLGIWKSTLIDQTPLYLILIQNVFMVVMWSFYGLKGRWGYLYSGAAILPLLVCIFSNQNIPITAGLPNVHLFSSFLVIALNFLIIILAHHYYRGILYKTIANSEKLNEDLSKSNAANTMFFSTMSHELRTPLNAVIGITNLLIDNNKDKEQRENLDILKFSAESLLSLINDILDFNKIGSGKVELESISFDLKALIENACAGLRIKAAEKNLYCITIIPIEIEKINVIGDPTRLLQIIYNLVGNAIKFTKTGGVEIQLSILNHTSDNISLRFSIQDTGLGIDKEQQQLIFEPFTQADVNTTRKYGGTGLGLSIVKHLLTLHNSSIHVESELNKGATFFFDMNYRTLKKQVNTDDERIEKINHLSLLNLKILLAEDNAINILLMKKLFLNWGIHIDIAENGEEVLDLLARQHYHVILMDIHMPVMNGYETTSRIRALEDPLKAATPIIALTASVSNDVLQNIAEVGMNDALGKPFKSEELYQKLEKLVALASS